MTRYQLHATAEYRDLGELRSLVAYVTGVVLLLLVVCCGRAGEYADNYAEDGYSYHAADGYWYAYGVPYTREKVTYYKQVPYYQYGYTYYHQQPYYYYKYSRYYPPKPALDYNALYEDNLRKVLEIAAARDKFEGRLREKANDRAAVLEAIQALGLQGNFTWQGYGQSPYRYQNLQAGSYGYNGNTLYSSQQVNRYNVNAYGTLDLNGPLQQGAAFVRDAGVLFGQGMTQYNGVVDNAIGRQSQLLLAQARNAEIEAKMDGVAKVVESVNKLVDSANARSEVNVSAESQTSTGGQAPVDSQPPGRTSPFGGVAPAPPAPQTSAPTLNRVQVVAAASCVQCHDGNRLKGDKLKGGYNVLTHWTLNKEARAKVVTAHLLLEPGADGFMPKGARRQLPKELVEVFLDGPDGRAKVEVTRK